MEISTGTVLFKGLLIEDLVEFIIESDDFLPNKSGPKMTRVPLACVDGCQLWISGMVFFDTGKFGCRLAVKQEEPDLISFEDEDKIKWTLYPLTPDSSSEG